MQWGDLPDQARAAVEARIGTVRYAVSAPAGLTRGVAACLRTASGAAFLKAVPLASPALPHYEREQHVNAAVSAHVPAPRLLWSERAGGWLLLLFEAVANGRPADLSPGSADIPLVIETVAKLTDALTPSPCPNLPPVSEKIEGICRYADKILGSGCADELLASAAGLLNLDAVAGDTLLHADLSEDNLLITNGGVRVVDWSLASRGAPWVDVALLTLRCIMAGHTPEAAERWAARVPAWRTAPPSALTGLIATRALFSTYMAANGPQYLRQRRAAAAAAGRAWVAYRRSYSSIS
ncbi:MAG: phosphotransferase [Thermobispora bispora]|nr:phosphotransferase [Thermobispora bispora]